MSDEISVAGHVVRVVSKDGTERFYDVAISNPERAVAAVRTVCKAGEKADIVGTLTERAIAEAGLWRGEVRQRR